MNLEARRRLKHALDACVAVLRFTAQKTYTDYLADEMLRAAVERKFAIIGEALHLAEIADESVTELVSDLRNIVGLRNRLIHGYERVDNEIVWRITQDNLPALMQQLEQALA